MTQSVVLLGALLFAPLLASAQSPGEAPAQTQAFAETAAQEYGERGRRAAAFLIESMPGGDRKNLRAEFLLANLRLAFAARDRFSWARDLPEERFLNDVLPYAVLDETREAWREAMLARVAPLVAGCASASEAAQTLNRELFKQIGVHYNTARKRPNQSPAESIAQGRATCTGLAIILVDACRAIGIPARVAGVAEWTTKPGNHTWVEIWDGRWQFLGADEYDAAGLDRGWFVEDAARAAADDPAHAVWASSWKPVDGHFPLAWDRKNHSIGAENVTARYRANSRDPTRDRALIHLRVIDSTLAGDDKRIVVGAELRDEAGELIARQMTKGRDADRNDMVRFEIAPGKYSWQLANNGETRKSLLEVGSARERIEEIDWARLPTESRNPAGLSRAQAEAAARDAWREAVRDQFAQRKKELAAKSLSWNGKNLHWAERIDGKKPTNGYALWISLHGGGGTTAEVNDAQARNQIDLYPPTDGIWIAPRSPTNAWNMWHEPHVDPMLDRVIEDYLIAGGVDPNRVYLLGYSAGGDGVYQLAPRMADRLAAAAMMAGHPNDASPLGLRNLPFAIFVGGADTAYRRNEVAAEWGKRLDTLQMGDPGGYRHWMRIYEGLGHWMNHRDAEAVPWLAEFHRNPWPKKIVWQQDDVTHDRFYWISVPKDSARVGEIVAAAVEGQTIRISTEGRNQLVLWLRDALLDLDQPVTVIVNGRPVFEGIVPRTAEAIRGSLRERADPDQVATAWLKVSGGASAKMRNPSKLASPMGIEPMHRPGEG